MTVSYEMDQMTVRSLGGVIGVSCDHLGRSCDHLDKSCDHLGVRSVGHMVRSVGQVVRSFGQVGGTHNSLVQQFITAFKFQNLVF